MGAPYLPVDSRMFCVAFHAEFRSLIERGVFVGHTVAGCFRVRNPEARNDLIMAAWDVGAYVRPSVADPVAEIDFLVDSDNETKLRDKLNELNAVPLNAMNEVDARDDSVTSNRAPGVELPG